MTMFGDHVLEVTGNSLYHFCSKTFQIVIDQNGQAMTYKG